MIVLIIEDEKELTNLWSRFLTEFASEIRIAHDPESGLRLMAEAPYPEIVLVDLGFPTSHPRDTIKLLLPKIRLINPEATITIITGNTETEIMDLSLSLGADYFARKPENASSQNSLLRAIKAGAQALTTREPSYTQPLRVLELLTTHLSKV